MLIPSAMLAAKKLFNRKIYLKFVCIVLEYLKNLDFSV